MKKLLFFLSFLLFSFQFTFAQPKIVVQKKQTQVQRVGEYIRFITPEIIDSTMCYPPDPKCNYLNRYERLKYDEYLIKNKSGIFVPDSIMLLAYRKRDNEEIFSFNKKLENLTFPDVFKKREKFKKTDIRFLEKEILIQNSLGSEDSYSVFYFLYVLWLISLSCLFFYLFNKNWFLMNVLVCILSFVNLLYLGIWFLYDDFTNDGIAALFLLQFLCTFALTLKLIIEDDDVRKLSKIEYIITLIILLLNSCYINFYLILVIILLPVCIFFGLKYSKPKKPAIDYDV